MEEYNRFTKRIKRYANLGSSASAFALKLAGTKLFKNKKTETADQLSEILGGLKGPVMKIGQLLSTIPDLLPPEYVNALSQLQSNAPPMGWNFVKRRMRSELGNDWEKKFKEFEKEPFAAASLGQVHKAQNLRNEKIACKLQYPDMSSIVEADINQLKLVFKIYRQIDSSIDTSNILKELSHRVREELDYERERKNLLLYANIFKKHNEVKVPQVFKTLCFLKIFA